MKRAIIILTLATATVLPAVAQYGGGMYRSVKVGYEYVGE